VAAAFGEKREVNNRAQIRRLSDGRRLHMHDGPIDLIVEAFGAQNEVEAAYRSATKRFLSVLHELCGELEFLRRPASEDGRAPSGSVAQRMWAAVRPYATRMFITPMAAVAGAVAEEILEAMTSAACLTRAYVNDGGDIALHLAAGEQFTIGMVELRDRTPDPAPDTTCRKSQDAGHPRFCGLFGSTVIDFQQPIRGIATSGWRGRSFSLGIADAVTVLAETAAMADAAATVIANAVDLPGHRAIGRIPACELAPDSDLGDRLVTQSVGELTPAEINDALERGIQLAESLRASELVRAAALILQGEVRVLSRDHSIQSLNYSGPIGSLLHA
jgi:ApbE superfamily uncharacterized protein (UPF0280 family)